MHVWEPVGVVTEEHLPVLSRVYAQSELSSVADQHIVLADI